MIGSLYVVSVSLTTPVWSQTLYICLTVLHMSCQVEVQESLIKSLLYFSKLLTKKRNKKPNVNQNKVLSFIAGKVALENVVSVLVLHSS